MSKVMIPSLNVIVTDYKVLDRKGGMTGSPYAHYSRAVEFEVLAAEWITPIEGDPMEVIAENHPFVSLYLADDDRDEWYQSRIEGRVGL